MVRYLFAISFRNIGTENISGKIVLGIMLDSSWTGGPAFGMCSAITPVVIEEGRTSTAPVKI